MAAKKGARTRERSVRSKERMQVEYTRSLNSYEELSKVGGKAYALMKLTQANYNVAGGFVITTESYEYWVENRRLPPGLRKQLEERLDWHSFEMEYPLIARSSATVEDQKGSSFAGRFTSFPNIRSIDKLLEGIVDIYENAHSKIVIDYCRFHKIDEDKIKMGVLVQQQVSPKYSGILFTRNPTNNKDEMTITYTEGVPWKLVSGKEEGKTEVLTEKSERFSGIYPIAKEIEEFFGAPQDIEWAFDGRDYIILQSRPITTLETPRPKLKRSIKVDKKAAVLTGIPASLGYARSKIQYVDDDVPVKEVEREFVTGNVLATRGLWLEYDKLMSRAGAIISSDNSINSHAAIIAREKKIPSIAGIDLKRLSRYATSFDEVIVDANNGRVIIPHPRVSIIRDTTEIKMGEMPEWTQKVDKVGLRIIDSLSTAITSGDSVKYKAEIKKAIKYMLDNARSHPEVTRPLYHRLATFFQDDFTKLLLRNYSQKHIIERLEYIDTHPQAKPSELIDNLYIVTKKYMNDIGELRVDGKRIWELELSTKRE